MNRLIGVCIVSGILMSVGCATSARYVVKEADWGVVAMPAPTTWPINHVENAHKLMEAHFPDGYVVDREEEVVTGKTTSTQSHIRADNPGEDSVRGFENHVTTTTDQSEWRIHYRRASAPAPYQR